MAFYFLQTDNSYDLCGMDIDCFEPMASNQIVDCVKSFFEGKSDSISMLQVETDDNGIIFRQTMIYVPAQLREGVAKNKHESWLYFYTSYYWNLRITRKKQGEIPEVKTNCRIAANNCGYFFHNILGDLITKLHDVRLGREYIVEVVPENLQYDEAIQTDTPSVDDIINLMESMFQVSFWKLLTQVR